MAATCRSTFSVDPVAKATQPVKSWHNLTELERIVRRISGVKPESYSPPSSSSGISVRSVLGDDVNPFVSTVHMAYDQHYPLVLSPDAIWMCIAQGFANHVNQNAKKLRHLFVEHKGKKEIEVRRDNFIKGSPTNPWPEVFEEFSQQIRKHVGDKTHELITPEFTTTGAVERAAAQVVLMNTFKAYFTYSVKTGCGIPEVTLEGTVDDWKKLRDKALALAQYDLEWWTKALKPVLDQFVSAAEGHVDRDFWSKIYKYRGGSGGPFITGWIATLFPYIGMSELRPNPYLDSWSMKDSDTSENNRLRTNMFPLGVFATPFIWKYYEERFPMHFYGGFMMVVQDPVTLALKPEIGWAVADEKAVETSKKKNYHSRGSRY